MADAGVALTVLPSTDLYLMGRHMEHSVMRGVTAGHKLLHAGVNCSLSTNNVLNPFTPFGDCSLIRMANLYANICQVGARGDIRECFNMITERSAALMRLRDYGIAVGKSADLVVLDCQDPETAVAELVAPMYGFKRGRQTFTREPRCVELAEHSSARKLREGRTSDARERDSLRRRQLRRARLRRAGRLRREARHRGGGFPARLHRSELRDRRRAAGAPRGREHRAPAGGRARGRRAGRLLLHVLPQRARRAALEGRRHRRPGRGPSRARELDPLIADPSYDYVLRKGAPSIFFNTPATAFFHKNRVDTMIVTGCITSGCVRASIVDSFSLGFRTIVPEDCVGDHELEPHQDNLRDVERRYADVSTADDVIRQIEAWRGRNGR